MTASLEFNEQEIAEIIKASLEARSLKVSSVHFTFPEATDCFDRPYGHTVVATAYIKVGQAPQPEDPTHAPS